MRLGKRQTGWNDATDVLVVGYGGAGAAAAIAARDAGAEVLIIEKAPFGGGNTACCLGNMRLANNVSDGIAYYRGLSFGTVADADLIRAFAEAMVGMPEELKAWGIDDWSRDNSDEIEKGWIDQANNLGELAAKIGADAAGLSETVTGHNAQCRG